MPQPTQPPALVFGPAYLDRVVRVDNPLVRPDSGFPPLDRSVDAVAREPSRPGRVVLIRDPGDRHLYICMPPHWDASETIHVSQQLPGLTGRAVRATAVVDDLGGMGAGFAALLGGSLISALGGEEDPTSRAVDSLLGRHAITHRPIRIEGREADWTLLISSGPHGDKLAIGFRGCHAEWVELPPEPGPPARVRVVAALPNHLAARALGPGGAATVRAFFPNAKAMLDREGPVAGFADRIDLLSCNRGEWLELGDGAAALDRVPVVAVTDGAAGASVRFVDPAGDARSIHVPTFPRQGPIRDTNRAGEAFGGTLLATLLAAGWMPGPVDEALIRHAAERGAVASALVLGREGFGFASPAEIDEALRRGIVPSP